MIQIVEHEVELGREVWELKLAAPSIMDTEDGLSKACGSVIHGIAAAVAIDGQKVRY